MNARLIATPAALVLISGCTAHGPLPATLTIGAPKQRTAPPGSGVPGYKSLDYPVQITNTSARPVWFFGPLLVWPDYEVWIRAGSTSPWKNETQPMCGMGSQFYELDPGASSSFTVMIPATDTGKQLRIELPIYNAPVSVPKPRHISTAVTTVR